ncbi:hypothetical protein SuNHUV7_39980 (plasmid) [Pseudoseohaeicola sp. NH-UV-7]|uniref:hypothetical protein n=1 Tax=unclassified Sulfitobacter TaxID=196795 RepID=UPI000E0BED17|nr:hypothetical protein [Sulfitobacter sp. JL08]AXI54175.1 hypothetical protein C1J05_06430 [Sulfitobacter sp. JL08]
MTDKVASLIKQISDLEDELEAEFERRRAALNFRIDHHRVVFEREIQKQHRALKKKLMSYVAGARPMVILTAPVIYAMIVPLMLLDVFVTMYQTICFPVYKIEKIQRGNFVTFDRKHLSYLNGLEKLNCMYCSYGNGVLAYAREIAASTELYWCPIKHARRMQGLHRHYPEFAEYGDAEGYQRRVQAARNKCL